MVRDLGNPLGNPLGLQRSGSKLETNVGSITAYNDLAYFDYSLASMGIATTPTSMAYPIICNGVLYCNYVLTSNAQYLLTANILDDGSLTNIVNTYINTASSPFFGAIPVGTDGGIPSSAYFQAKEISSGVLLVNGGTGFYGVKLDLNTKTKTTIALVTSGTYANSGAFTKSSTYVLTTTHASPKFITSDNKLILPFLDTNNVYGIQIKDPITNTLIKAVSTLQAFTRLPSVTSGYAAPRCNIIETMFGYIITYAWREGSSASTTPFPYCVVTLDKEFNIISTYNGKYIDGYGYYSFLYSTIYKNNCFFLVSMDGGNSTDLYGSHLNMISLTIRDNGIIEGGTENYQYHRLDNGIAENTAVQWGDIQVPITPNSPSYFRNFCDLCLADEYFLQKKFHMYFIGSFVDSALIATPYSSVVLSKYTTGKSTNPKAHILSNEVIASIFSEGVSSQLIDFGKFGVEYGASNASRYFRFYVKRQIQ